MSLSNSIGGPPLPPDQTYETSEGLLEVTQYRSRPVTLADAEQWVRESGKDPADYTISARATIYGDGLFSNKMSATPRLGVKNRERYPVDEMLTVIDKWKPTKQRKTVQNNSFVLCPADPQIGKHDWNGSHAETIERMLSSYAAAAEFCSEYRPAEIVIAALGDDVENIHSVSSQRGTNSLALTEQIRVARRVALEGIKMLAPLTPKLTYASVPSNHGSVRIGPKSPENHVLDDYGIEIAEQIRDVANESPRLSNVRVVIPDPYHESLLIETSGTKIGMAHGHQAASPDKLSDYWRGQSHGRMPLAEADIALFGHYHSLRVQQSGDARWLFVSPAQDGGSSWFTNKTGERSVTGMLSFTTRDGAWDNLRVL